MKIGIIDAEIIGKKRHRFPNLASMKLSGYNKSLGNTVSLILDYNKIIEYDKVYISKVFTDTYIPKDVLELTNVEYGGTGFFYDKAIPLLYEIEHHMPDYNLYDEWIQEMMHGGANNKEFEYYKDYSIGFTTRGCFRKCPFCVNKNYDHVSIHSPIVEFYDSKRKYICLLDDNVLGFPRWDEIFKELQLLNIPFQYKQGMDERILNDEKCNMLAASKYKGDFIFAFDDIEDKEIIEDKLKLWRSYVSKTTKLYVFCGYDRNDNWDKAFWKQDIEDLFKRIKILMIYGCLPYIMRFNRYEESPYRGTYINLARWCNQPSFFKKKSYREFCLANQSDKSDKECATITYMKEFERDCPDIATQFYNLKYEELNTYK